MSNYSNGVKTVETLRAEGYKVRVYHGREVYRMGVGYTIMSKREFCADPRDFDMILSHGGFTRVEVTTPAGDTVIGKFNFNSRQFNRKLGLQAAIGRALAQVPVTV